MVAGYKKGEHRAAMQVRARHEEPFVPGSISPFLEMVTRLGYYGARYYDRVSLRWAQTDPLYRFAPDLAYDQPRRMGLYTFNLNNALLHIDPDGRNPNLAAKLYEMGAIERIPMPPGGLLGAFQKVVRVFSSASTEDQIALGSQVVPYAGDYVAVGVSAKKFIDAPTPNSATDLLLDVVGAALPLVGALGSVRRVERVRREVRVPSSRYPETAAHIKDAQRAGHPAELTIDRPGAPGRRAESLAG
jgi:RHS repeat-associated protein